MEEEEEEEDVEEAEEEEEEEPRCDMCSRVIVIRPASLLTRVFSSSPLQQQPLLSGGCIA